MRFSLGVAAEGGKTDSGCLGCLIAVFGGMYGTVSVPINLVSSYQHYYFTIYTISFKINSRLNQAQPPVLESICLETLRGESAQPRPGQCMLLYQP